MAEERNKHLFRQEALDRIASPEQFNDYLHVTNAGVWVFLSVVILLLAAFIAWSALGTLETTVAARAAVSDGTARMTVLENAEVTAGMTVRIGDSEFRISDVTRDEMGLTFAFAPVNLANGNYDAVIVVETLSPISFLLAA